MKCNILFLPIFTLSLCTITSSAMAASPRQHAQDITILDCALTPEVETVSITYPGTAKINRTNNLRRKTGSAWVAKGVPVLIKGRVLDERCVPVPHALVEIWQADSKGRTLDGKGTHIMDPFFQGSGAAYTNNVGEYSFLTVYP
ncbi:MAG: hypothetical protein KDD76_06765, partial [Rickettsiales bacterium]|nr:hypothetical protein [Rickettsiales bacterium]